MENCSELNIILWQIYSDHNCSDAFLFACLGTFQGSLVRTKEITFSFQVEFWKHEESMRKFSLYNCCTRMVHFYSMLTTYPHKKNFHVLSSTKLLSHLLYLEDRSRRFLTDALRHLSISQFDQDSSIQKFFVNPYSIIPVI